MSSSLPRPGAAAITANVISTAHASAELIATRQSERLAELLEAARAAPFYRDLLRDRRAAQTALSALPPVERPSWMAHFADGVTDPQLTLASLQAFCADPQLIGQRYRDRYWVWESSGSSGQPGVFVHDETAMAVYDALEATRRHSPRPWVRLCDPFYLGERFAFVGAIDGHFASHVSVQRQRLGNPWLERTWQNFSILQPTPALVSQLNAFAPTIVATYPTAAAMLADETRQGRLRIRPQEIWTGGETLSPPVRKHIEQAFGCALRNSYGASEFLPIAWECGEGRLHVNADWVILEPVDEHMQPVAPGQPSHTTLLTNLANHVQPLIRFDIGDRVVLGAEQCACGSALPVIDVQGRRDDVLVVAGRHGDPVTLLPLALTTLLEDDAGVFDFQLQQLAGGSWRLTLGPGANASNTAAERCKRVLAEFAVAQGAVKPRIVTHRVDALPQGRSGKVKRIVAASGPGFVAG
jgi:phenylacetate-coenzyme A ligase PaaK-like adenylate-forming protein